MIRNERFSASNQSNTYLLPNLSSDKWYGVYFEYKKSSPFWFHQEQRFIVESPAENSTHARRQPLYIRFPLDVLSNKTGKLKTVSLPQTLMVKDDIFKGYEIRVTYYPPCNANNFTQFWLKIGESMRSLNSNLEGVICSSNYSLKYCEKDSIQKSNSSECNSIICYKYQIRVFSNLFDSKEICNDIIEFYRNEGILKNCNSERVSYLYLFMTTLFVFYITVFLK